MEIATRQIFLPDTRSLRQSVLRPHESVGELAQHEPAGAFAVGAFVQRALVSVGFVAPDGEAEHSWRVRGVATVVQARGQGAGAAVLRELLNHARAHGAERVWCNARIPATSLYARAGFSTVSERFELPQIGPHLVMEWRPPASGPQPGSRTGDSRVRTKGLNPSRS